MEREARFKRDANTAQGKHTQGQKTTTKNTHENKQVNKQPNTQTIKQARK